MPSHAQDRAAFGDAVAAIAAQAGPGPRGGDPGKVRYWTLAPTVLSQPPVMTGFIADCSSSVGKTAAS